MKPSYCDSKRALEKRADNFNLLPALTIHVLNKNLAMRQALINTHCPEITASSRSSNKIISSFEFTDGRVGKVDCRVSVHPHTWEQTVATCTPH